ncbi:MAG: succinate-semialdehyde dehydrogenase, partial [Phenylobacterium sp.]|nr:succinate-semialdehyde dehydrogenase [Phenylobacterium sp.]
MPERPTFQTIDPATGKPGRSYDGHAPDEALAIARAVRQAFDRWKHEDFDARAALMSKAAAVLRRRADEFAGLMTDEMGKTLAEGRAEVEKCAGHCDYFAEHAPGFLADRPVDIGGPRAKVAFRPLGVILAVMPWNFPFWQVFR